MNKATKQGTPPIASIFGEISVEWFQQRITHNLISLQGRDPLRAGDDDVYRALSYALRELLMEKWLITQKNFYAKHKKRV